MVEASILVAVVEAAVVIVVDVVVAVVVEVVDGGVTTDEAVGAVVDEAGVVVLSSFRQPWMVRSFYIKSAQFQLVFHIRR